MERNWIQLENGGSIKLYDIQLLRKLGRDPGYCNNVDEQGLDIIFRVLFDEDEVLTTALKIDVVATISNILLVNRDIHIDYFTPKYSKQVFVYCDTLINELGWSKFNDRTNFRDLVPIYRILFLTLYGALDEVDDTVIEDVFNILFDGFKLCVEILEHSVNDVFYQLLLIEILKCLYTLHHKYHYGSNLVQDEEFSDDCLRLVNYYSVQSTNAELIIKNTLNFLLVLFSEREVTSSKEMFAGPMDTYATFFDNVKILLEKNLLDAKNSEDPEEHLPVLTNLVVVIGHMLSLLVDDIKTDTNDDKFQKLHSQLSNNILPLLDSKFIYNELIALLALLPLPHGSSQNSFTEMQQKTLIRHSILDLFYKMTYTADTQTHQESFLKLVGYVNSNSFVKSLSPPLNPSVNVNDYMEPTSEYLDRDYYLSKKADLFGLYSSPKKEERIEELTPEEKEQEADKLFEIFERMEKLGTFENFENPVKKWQREGKFEELDKES